MLENFEKTEYKIEKKKIIVYVLIILLCIISVIVAVANQAHEMAKPNEYDIVETNIEIKEFSTIFDNSLNLQGNTISKFNLTKEEDNKKLVYSGYEKVEKQDGKYDLQVMIPRINIKSVNAQNINKEIEQIFWSKAKEIMSNNDEKEVIYTVEYTACVNDNLLSLIIKSTLKDGKNAQRVISQGYTYNLSSDERVNFSGIMRLKNIDSSNLKKQISKVVNESQKQNESLKSLGYSVYERDLSNNIYNIENIENYFLGQDNVLYVVFAYGNNNYTSEIDVITIK